MQGRSGTGHFYGDWHAKSEEILVKKSVFRRHWFQRSVVVFVGVFGLAAIAAIWHYESRQRDRATDLAHAYHSLAEFARSDEFAAGSRALNAQLLATLNYVASRADAADAMLPGVAAWEKAHHVSPWPLELPTLPTAAPPARVVAVSRTACSLLAARDFVFDETLRRQARLTFAHALEPYATAYFRREPEHTFSGLRRDSGLQDRALAAFAAQMGPHTSVSDVERLFFFLGKYGPDMWSAVEHETKKPTPPPAPAK